MRAPEAKGMTSDTEDDAAKPETKFRPRPTFRSTPAKRGTTIVLPTDVSPSIWSSPPSTPRDEKESFESESQKGRAHPKNLLKDRSGYTTKDAELGVPVADLRAVSDGQGVLDTSESAKRVPYVTIIADIISGFGSGKKN